MVWDAPWDTNAALSTPPQQNDANDKGRCYGGKRTSKMPPSPRNKGQDKGKRPQTAPGEV